MSFDLRYFERRSFPHIISRGRKYLNRVHVTNTQVGTVTAHVTGTDVYITRIFSTKGAYDATCTCPYSSEAYCKHIIALAYIIKRDPQLSLYFDTTPSQKSTTADTRVLTTILQKAFSSHTSIESARTTRNIIHTKRKVSILEYRISPTYTPPTWSFHAHEPPAPLEITVIIQPPTNTPKRRPTRPPSVIDILRTTEPGPLDAQILQTLNYHYLKDPYSMAMSGGTVLTFDLLTTLWPHLARAPHVYWGEESTPLTLSLTRPAWQLAYHETGDTYRWLPQLTGPDGVIDITNSTVHLFDYPNPLCRVKDTLYLLSHTLPLQLNQAILDLPPQHRSTLEDPAVISQLCNICTATPLQLPPSLATNIVLQTPTPCFIINTSKPTWEVNYLSEYGAITFPFSTKNQETYVDSTLSYPHLAKRDLAKEEVHFAEAHQIINVDVHPDALLPFVVLPEQHDHFLKRLRSHIPINWKLYLNTPKNQVKRGALHTTYSSTSGIDWLDIEATFRHPDSDSSHTLADIMQVYTPGDQFLTLGESSYLIDETTSQTLSDLALHYRPSTKSIRMHQSHVGLLDELTSLCGVAILPPQWKTSLDTYRNFTRITPRTLPSTLTATLRPYQQEGVHWLSFLRDFRFGGILADDMGLGKTIQAISILALSHQDAKPIHPSLIVAPTSVVANWQRECARFAPTLRTYLYAEKDRALPPSGTVDIIITSYALLWRDADIFTPLQFHYVVLDEAHYIKNHTSRTSQTARKLNAEYRLSLTGTPLENNLSELWAQSAFINPSHLGTYEEFKKSYLNPIQKEQSTQAKKKLQTMMKPFLLRRLKDQVAQDLPPKVESVQWVHMEPKQRKLYNQLKKHFQEKVHGIIHKKGIQKSQIEILEALLRLRQACCHPLLLTELTDTLKKNGFKSIDAATVGSAKYEAALDLIETAAQEGHKILVFSQFVRMIDILAKGLIDRSVSHTSLTGSTKNRQAVIDAYQSPNGPSVFLLGLKAGGTGLNLTAADYVVHFDPWWNPAVEAQATDRTHRIGQQKRVFVYKFLVKDSIEEKILKLQEKKGGAYTGHYRCYLWSERSYS